MIPGTLEETIRFQIAQCEGWCSPEKALRLAEMVIANRPKLAVEIGVFGGRSIFAIASAMKHIDYGEVYGIDPWSVDSAVEGEVGAENEAWWRNNVNLQNIYSGYLSKCIEYGLTDVIYTLRLPSEQAVRLFNDGSIDVLHQDSNHSELVSCRDVEMWHSKMAKTSTWILDDADWPTQQKAIQMIKDCGFKVLEDHQNYIIFSRVY